MAERERHRERKTDRPAGEGGSPQDGAGLESLFRDAERLLSVGQEEIDRALSGDSRAYLREMRQEGGQ